MLKMFSSSEVKGQGHEHAKCYNSEDVHFDDVALRFSCFLTAHKNDRQTEFPTEVRAAHRAVTESYQTGC